MHTVQMNGIVLKGGSLCFFKQKTEYEIVSGDWSSDVCSSDLMEAGADFEERADAAMNFRPAFGGARDAGKDFEKRGLAGAVAADEAEDFAFVKIERNVFQSPKHFGFRAAKSCQRRTNEFLKRVAETGIDNKAAAISFRQVLAMNYWRG